ncbi:MAG: hypothetical protein AB1765_00975 [Candidatus Hydrogenedentota bacterium]
MNFELLDNNLIRIEQGDTIIEYEYSATGKRISTSINGRKTLLFYDNEDVIEEVNASDSEVIKWYIHGPGIDEPLAFKTWVDSPGLMYGGYLATVYLHEDGLGSIVYLSACVNRPVVGE